MLFPEPFGPIIAVLRSELNSKERLLNTRVLPWNTDAFFISNIFFIDEIIGLRDVRDYKLLASLGVN